MTEPGLDLHAWESQRAQLQAAALALLNATSRRGVVRGRGAAWEPGMSPLSPGSLPPVPGRSLPGSYLEDAGECANLRSSAQVLAPAPPASSWSFGPAPLSG